MKSVTDFLSSATFFALAVLAASVALLCTHVVTVNEALPLVGGLMAALKVAASIDNHAQATLDAAAASVPATTPAPPTTAQALAVLAAAVAPSAPAPAPAPAPVMAQAPAGTP